ncbi:MAG: DUF3494 domain-containing protein [Bacteroidetes bacterium]|nr:DUF3494 domain-containing protein [Bacteroidota bacterium]
MMRKITGKILERFTRQLRNPMKLGMLIALLIPSIAMSQSQAPLDLDCAETFAVLAGSTITSTGFSVISGNVGLSPGSATVGFPPAIVVNGALHINDALANNGQSCLTIAYNDAAGRTPVPSGPFLNPGSGNIGGLTLVAGLYKFTSTASITGSNVTLTGGANDVWIFQIASNLVVGNGVHVVLSGGAQANNIFWQVGTSATIGTTAMMKGSILADQSISLNTGAVLDGRALARIGAVTIDGNAVTKPLLTTTAPTVISTIPSDTATFVPISQYLSATFSEVMDPATINETTFILIQGTNSVPGVVSYNGLVGTFNPTNDLSSSTMYTATITIGAKNLTGDALERDYVWSFRTGAAADTTAPKIRSTLPADNATLVPVNQRLTATFSEVMDPVSITQTTFVLRKGQTQIPGTVVYVGLTATFKPTVALTSDTTYAATITSGVKDLAGNRMTADYVWSFETDVSVDLTAPTVVSTVPVNAATDVPINKSIAAVFSEVMDPSTISTASFTLTEGMTPVTGTVTFVGVTATFSPSTPLTSSKIYTATILNTVEDLAGNRMAVDYVWYFQTGAAADTTAPTIRSTLPANNATLVPVNQRLAATFNEVMDPGSITPTTFVLRKGQTQIPGTVVYVGLTATFKPTVALTSDTTYTATITSGVMDLAGNRMIADYVWRFDTDVSVDLTAPTVISTVPVNFATGVGINKSITATFSEVMDPWTITSTSFLLRSGEVLVTGAITYADSTAVFTPSSHLTTNMMYSAKITIQAADLAGNHFAMDYDWTFTTGAALPAPLPIDLDCANDFTVLAGSTVTSTGNTIIHGDVGLSPGTQVVGFPPGQVLDGSIHINDALANNAQLCLTIAYNDAAGRTFNAIIVSDGELGGKTLAPGLYRSAPGSFGITNSDLTLDAQGDVNAVWIFQMPSSTLTVGNGRQVILAGGADAGNVFWQVGSAATIGTTAAMAGTIMADQSIALNTGATLNGRALARIAEVTFDGNTVIRPDIILSVHNDMVPSEFTLSQNFPNPFNPLTQIEYGIAKPSMVHLRVYNAFGVEVATLVNSYQDAGNYIVSFNTNESTPQLTSGVYVYRLEAGAYTSMSRKLILLK